MITPVDIQSKTFKSGIGYDKRDVDAFVSEILFSFKDLYHSNIEMKDKLTMLNDSLQHYKNLEASLQKALMLAEKTSEDALKNAEEKAKSIELDALNKAMEYTSNSKKELEKVQAQTASLIQQYTNFKAQFNQLLQNQTNMLTQSADLLMTDDIKAFAASNNITPNSSSSSFASSEDFGTFNDDPQGRDFSTLGGNSDFGGLGECANSYCANSFGDDPYADPKMTSAGSELSGISLLKADPFEGANSPNSPYNTTDSVSTPVTETTKIVESAPIVDTLPDVGMPSFNDTSASEDVEVYGDDVYVGEIEDKIDRRTLISDGEEEDQGFEFI